MVALLKRNLQIITAEVIREEHGEDFIHALVLINKRNKAIVGWYNSPGNSRQFFYEKLKYVLTKYNVRCPAGDLNARQKRWCTAHDKKRRGKQLLTLARELRSV